MISRLVFLLCFTVLVQKATPSDILDVLGDVINALADAVVSTLFDEDTDTSDKDLDWLYELLEPEDQCNPNPCHNDGVCEVVDDDDFRCSCPPPYKGKTCQKVRNICKKANCVRGECTVTLTPPYYECKCKEPYQPPNCKVASSCNPSPCLNGGTCRKGVTLSSFWCDCPANYTGNLCQVGPDDCYEENGENYRGNVSETVEGLECLPWNAYFILSEAVDLSEYNILKELEHNNLCRNPDGDARPWCFVRLENELTWEYCKVRKCSGSGNETEPTEPNEETTEEPTLIPDEDFATCGQLQTKRVAARIYRGMKAEPGAYPWQVSLQVRPKGTDIDFGHYCGGILIRSCWVLTAAHCINNDTDKQVVLGVTSLKKFSPDVQVIDVVEAITHEDYRETPGALYNDVALLRLKGSEGRCANETETVRTACLPTETFPDKTECTISGWGATEKAYISNHLLYAPVLLLSQKRCMEEKVYGNRLDGSMLCAGNMKGGVDSCQGDSGGPLVCEKDGTHYVYGVVSWGDSCGKRNKPGIYARVTTFLDWIDSKLSAS
uniref:trypsin n=1 Tax=Scleropages formosus TaxID=113540 RepID=A0A8C9SLD9_SCLFO